MANLPLAFGELLAGGVLLTAGITGHSAADVLAGNIGFATSTASAAGGGSGSATLGSGSAAGGFLPPGAKYKAGRKDQGHDGQTDPGGPLVAPGDGTVVAILHNPGGFGPAYPVVKFTTGPYAGQDPIYLGHTISALHAGASFVAGQVLSHTGKTPIGNASTPGWFEIGYAPGGSPGPMGQRTPY